jgi:truncated hemoglobin YjbI
VTTALIAVGGTILGVLLGWALQWWSGKRARTEDREERRDWARHEREIAAAEHLDEALVRVFAAFQGKPDPDTLLQAFSDWSDGWVAYAGRLGDPELRERHRSVATMLLQTIDAEADQPSRRHTLVEQLNQGEAQGQRLGPLREWLQQR